MSLPQGGIKLVASPGDSWIAKFRQSAESEADGWFCVRGLTACEAEQFLDWLEANGIDQRELTMDPDQGFGVRWRP
jgi:hypothetical protein